MESRQNSVCVKHLTPLKLPDKIKQHAKKILHNMYIGGFQKNSLIDFPETIACIVFTQGCNLICPYCHNPELVVSYLRRGYDLYDENQIFRFLKKRKRVLEGVVITGGEPTLQKDLIQFCNKIKNIGYKIKLDSNGTRPQVLETLFKNKLIDFISMDIKTSLANYNLVLPSEKFDSKIITNSIQIIMEKAPLYEFRTTCSRPFVNEEIMADIGKMIRGASKYILQKCSRNVKVLAPDFLKSDDIFFSDSQMIDLKNVIDKYVLSSIIR